MKKATITVPDIPFIDEERQGVVQLCAKRGCEEMGTYKAPKSPDHLREYFWFCLEHVREYNKNWNFFGDKDASAIEETIRSATIWDRPSQVFGVAGGKQQGWQKHFHDPFNFIENNTTNKPPSPPLTKDEKKAWKIFGLEASADQDAIKKRYKVLAKTHHPDANGGSRQAENRLKSINWAYAILKK